MTDRLKMQDLRTQYLAPPFPISRSFADDRELASEAGKKGGKL